MEVVVYLTSCKVRVAGVDVLPCARSWRCKGNAWHTSHPRAKRCSFYQGTCPHHVSTPGALRLINTTFNCREIYPDWEEGDFLLQRGMLRPGCCRGFEPPDTSIVSSASNPPQVFNPASHCFSSISLSKMALPADVDFSISPTVFLSTSKAAGIKLALFSIT